LTVEAERDPIKSRIASPLQGAIFKADILDNGAIRFNLAGELRRPCRGGIV
jgi:hypothetical protein